MAASTVLRLQTIVSREISPLDQAGLTIGSCPRVGAGVPWPCKPSSAPCSEMLVSLPVLGSVLLLVRTASHAARTEYRHAVTVS